MMLWLVWLGITAPGLTWAGWFGHFPFGFPTIGGERYRTALLEATTRDLRQYKTELGKRQKPASVNAAQAALRRFYAWAADTERIARNCAQHLTDVGAQPLAPKGFSDVERRRLVREGEKAGPMAEAIVMLLRNTTSWSRSPGTASISNPAPDGSTSSARAPSADGCR